jgi:hypothetical protein
MKAMEPEPDPKQVAGTTSEQVYISEATQRPRLLRYLRPHEASVAEDTAVKAVAPKKSEDRHKSIEEGCEKARSKKEKSSAGRKASGKKKAKR